jgi:putative tryptophan/tyrosine transport system substrate-binding protein
MRRRQFISLLGGVSAATMLPAAAQQPKRLPIVALVLGVAPLGGMLGADPAISFVRAFVHGLRDLGWIDGRSVVIERRSAEGAPQRAPAIFSELVDRGTDVIMVGGERWLQDAARAATKTIPIVASFRDDPVAAGVISSLARPGGNLTGVTFTTGPEFYGKRLQLLRELVPGISRVAVLAPSAQLEQVRGVPLPAGLTVLPVEADIPDQLENAFATILRERADALMPDGAGVTFFNSQRLLAFAAENRLPAIYTARDLAAAGGLMSYGIAAQVYWGQMARLVARFLDGAGIGSVPVEQPTKFELVINLKTARSLGIPVPAALSVRADDVIE